MEKSQFAYDHRMYRLIARHRPTGELAGQTIVIIPAAQPWFAHQLDTSVVRIHRGHRLGMALKIAMVRALAQAEPQARTLGTWNAASNEHMIGINESLGYRVVSRAIGWQKHLPRVSAPGDADLLAPVAEQVDGAGLGDVVAAVPQTQIQRRGGAAE
jgi:hypothetical protein